MQPNYKEQPLKEEINDPAGDSSKLTKEKKNVQKEKKNPFIPENTGNAVQDQVKYMLESTFGIMDLNQSIDVVQEQEKQNKQKILNRVQNTIDKVEEIAKEQLPEVSSEDYTKTVHSDIFEDSKESLVKLTKTGRIKKFIDGLNSSLPKRVHDQAQSDFLKEQALTFINDSNDVFQRKYGKTPDQVISENNVNSTEYLEARSLLHLNKFVSNLHETSDDGWWEKVDWKKSFDSQTPDVYKGLISNFYRSISSQIGMSSIDIPITSEGKQNLLNKIYKDSFNKLPEDSFLKQKFSNKDLDAIFNFSVMDKMPNKSKPFLVDALDSITGSLAALPMYMWGLEELALIKGGESGLSLLGGKEFTKRLLMSPVYTQPFQMGTDMERVIKNSKSIQDIFLGLGKSYMNGLTEVVGEVSTPILAKGLGKLKLWNALTDSIENKLLKFTGKYNEGLKTAVDWALISPVTETVEEEISNFLNADPSVFTGDFDIKRLSIEAISSLGMGIPIGIISTINKNKAFDQIKTEYPDEWNEFKDTHDNHSYEEFSNWINELYSKDNQSKTIVDIYKVIHGNEVALEVANKIAENKPELLEQLKEQISLPDIDESPEMEKETKGSFVLQAIRDVFGTISRPEEVTLPMVADENIPETFKTSKITKTLYHGTTKQFNTFNKAYLKTGEGANAYGEGFYFTENRRTAFKYSGLSSGGFLQEENQYEPDFFDEYYHEAELITPFEKIPKAKQSEEEFSANYNNIYKDKDENYFKFVYNKTKDEFIKQKYNEYVEDYERQPFDKEYNEEEFNKNLGKMLNDAGYEVLEVNLNIQNPISTSSNEYKELDEQFPDRSELTRELTKRGYDGIEHYSKQYEEMNYIVFSPSQIFIKKGLTRNKITEIIPTSKPQLSNPVDDVNTDVTVFNQYTTIDHAPNQDHNDKASQQEEKQNVSVQMSINGMVTKLLNKGINLKVYGLETPEKLWNYVQSFKTGNHELDWMKFEVDWLQKFGDTLSQPIPNSSRTLLQDLFITNYFATKKKAVQLKIGKDGKIQVTNLTGNAYVDADNKSKSLIGQEELWEKIQDALPDGTAVYSINLIERNGSKYNNFGDIKDKNNPIDFNAIRTELLKQGYVWSGLFPGSNTSLVADVKSLLPDFKDVPLEEAHSTLWNMMFDALLGEGLDPLTKIKRSKATTGESPSSYIFPETKTLLDKTTPASSIYISEENGKTKLNYKYVVINSDTIPKDFESELGDGEEYVTPFFAKIYYSINGTPYLKRGAMKPKFFDIGKFWKWARKIRKPQSKLDYFMKKNNIAGIVFSSVQKVGKDANMIDWKQLDTMQDVTDFVYEHDMLQDSDLFDKGKISKKAAGAGPNFATTGILNFMSKQGKDDTLKWLERDFQETQEYVDKLIQNPEFFEKEVQDYVANMDYEDDIVNFIKSSQGSPYLLRHPSVTDFLMKGYLKDQLFEAARHYKRGSSPALVLDIGGNIGYKSIEGSNQEAFDDKGFLKDNYILIDYFTAKKLNYKVGDKVIVALNPPGAPVDIRAIEIAGILPQEIGANQVVASVRQFQDWSGKDGDIDTLNVLSVKDELDVKVWQHIKNADMDNRFAKMMKDFESVNRAKLIVKTLYGREATEKEIQSWKRIAPLVKLDGDDKGVFALNMNFATIDFKNKDDWNGIQKLSHEGLIGQLYNWKAIYTLFLENDYELNGVRANTDIEFTLPMLKQLTDMALDWTKTLDIAKIQFNWEDLIRRLFIFGKVGVKEGSRENDTLLEKNQGLYADAFRIEQFNKDLRPIRQAFSLITQRDKTLEKYDYIKYHQAIQQIRKELTKLPSGLGRSILGITTRGLDAIQLPKLALTRPQFTNVTDNLKSVFLNVDKENIKNAQQVHIDLVNNSGLGQALNVTKALSRLGTNTNNPQDEVANINILKQETINRRQARAGNPEIVNTPLYDIYFTWLDGVMETPIAKQDGEVEIGRKIKNGYRYKITSINGETNYQILSYYNNQITDTQAFTDWDAFRKEAGVNFEGLSLTNEFNEVFWNLISTNNQVVKNVSDSLLKQVFPRIVETPGFQRAGKDIKRAFTYGILGLLDSNDWGLQVSDKPGLRNPIGNKTFIKPDKANITSWAKPITYLENFAYKDDVILETVIRFKKTLNTLIEQEIEKEKDLSRNAGKMSPSSFVPLPILDSKKISLSDVMRLIPYQMTQDEAQVWVDKLLNENIISDNDKKIFEKVVLKGLKQADIKYGFKWRAALDFNPLTSLFINSHNIPFDVFIDLFGKKNKLYSANQVVYSFPINGKMFDVTSNEIDIKFKHWNLRTKANLISNAQVWWYVQDALDRHYEKSRINYEEQVASVTEFALAKDMELDKDIRWTYTDVKIFQDKTMLEAFELAEDDNFKTAISGFDLNSDKKAYFDFAKSKMDNPTPKQVRRYVAAMRYRYLFDNLVESAILKQITNMQLIQDIAIKGNNLSAYTMAQGFIEQLETMTKQVRGINAYMPHTWDSKDFWMQARKDIYIEQGKSEQEALKRAKKDWEDKEARNAHIGGLGNYVDTFFLTREANMKGYNKTPNAANMYFNQLNRMFRFQHLFAMEELADEMLQDEIPFLKSHAKQMSAILRGADKYGVRVDISELKPNQLVLFNELLTAKDYISRHIAQERRAFILRNQDQFPEREEQLKQVELEEKDWDYGKGISYDELVKLYRQRLYAYVFKRLNGIEIKDYKGISNKEVAEYFKANKDFINSTYVNFGGTVKGEKQDVKFDKIENPIIPNQYHLNAYEQEFLEHNADYTLLQHYYKIKYLQEFTSKSVDGKTAGMLISGKVEKVSSVELKLQDNKHTFNKTRISGLKRLYGVSLETKARIALNKLGINANTDKQRLPTMMQYILKLQANSMLTGNTFAVRNVLGGMLQEFVYFGNEVQAKAETFMKNVGIDKISSGELTDEQKEQFELIYDNSIALLGNLDEIMGKFGGMISVLNEVEGLPKEIVTNIVLLQKKHNRVKVDAAEYGIDTKFRIENGKMHGAMIEKIWKHYQTAVKLLNINPMGVFGRFQNVSWINPASGEKWLRFHTAISAIEAHRGLDITDPYQKRILIAYIDQAIRNTQFLYRVGIDQGILESSPTARALYSNYQHYPMSSFTTTWYYIDNMLKQNKEYKGRLIDFIDTDEYKARFGKGSKINYMVINQGTPEEEVIQYADINYGRVVARNVTVGLALKLLDIGGKVFQQRLRYAGLPLIVDSLAYFAGITSTSYVTTPMATAIFEMVSYFGSLMMNPKDDEKWLKSIKKALYQSREDYMKDVRDKEWADDVSNKVINSTYTQNLIREILEKIPLGVGQRNMIDALIVSLLFGITPDAYQEIGVNVANQIFPIRLLRNPMLGSILGDEYAQPLAIGYNKLHTARLKYEQKNKKNKDSKSKFNFDKPKFKFNTK